MCFKKTISFLLFLIAFSSINWAQESTRLKRLNLEDGLSQSSIHQIFQDVQGFIWIATEDGLNRYDGYQFTIYRPSAKNKQSISNNWIYQIQQDSEGNLWIATYYGLSKWNREKNNFTNFVPENTKEIKGRDIPNIYCTKNDVLWFVNDKEIGNYNIKTKQFSTYDNQKYKFPTFGIHTYISILEDAEGKIWIISRDMGVVVFKNNIPSILKAGDGSGLVSNNIRNAVIGKDGEVWLSSMNGLMHYDSKTEQFLTISNDPKSDPQIPSSDIKSAIFDYQDNLWIVLNKNGIVKIDLKTKLQTHYQKSSQSSGISTNSYNKSFKDYQGKLWFFADDGISGLTIYDTKTNKFNSYQSGPNGLSNNNLTTFFSGKSGEVWIGTTGGGLNIYNPQLENFKHIYRAPQLDSALDQNDVREILKDKKGRTWIGTLTGINMKQADDRGFVFYPYNSSSSNGIATRGIYKIYQDKQERIWLGAYNGIYLFDEKLKSFKKIKIISKFVKDNGEVRFIYEDKHGDLLITYNHATLVKLYNDEMIFNDVAHFDFLEEQTVNRIINLKDNKIFFATWNSFFIYDNTNQEVKHYKYQYGNKVSISNPEVNEALIQNDSILWLATANGLNRFNINTETFKYYFIEDGLPNQYIYYLLMDADQHIWMSTNKGISKFNTQTETFRNYDVNDGLQSNEFNGGAAFTNGKEFFFGGINGYNQFFPDQIKINSNPPLIYFTDLYVNNIKITADDSTKILDKSLEKTPIITLKEGIANLSIEFVALDYINTKALSYFYSLEKTGTTNSNDWYQVTNQRSVNITKPEYGDYILKIKAVNKDGIASEIKQLEIIILPPFYKTTWFKVLVSLILIFSIFAFYRIRLRAIQKQKNELQKQVEERTHEVVEQRDEAEKQKKVAIQQKEEVAIQKEIVEIKNKEIIDSIHYAKRIQDALLQAEGYDTKHFPPHFILFKPKDIVSGDFYWALEKQEYLYIAAVDCTGHGVPGAFMSMLGIAYLNEINANEEIISPAAILDRLRNKIVENLSSEKGENKDGMDMSLYKLNLKNNELEWAGSNNPLWIVAKDYTNYSDLIKKGEKYITVFKKQETDTLGIIEIKPDKQSIGYNEYAKPFVNHFINLQKNDSIYIFTDGFADQFGGEKGKKFKYKSLKQLVLEIENLPMELQKTKMIEVFENWRGPLEQIDDVCLIGLKI